MEIGRRPVLQGLLVTGIATMTGGFRPADATSPPRFNPFLVLTEKTHGRDFLTGVRSVWDGEVVQETASLDLHSVTRILVSGQRRLLLGLVDDGAAAVLVELARGAGGRVRWLGHHSIHGAVTRHRLLTTSRGKGALFARDLHACGAQALVRECNLSGGRKEFSTVVEANPSSATLGWAAALGRVLASVDGAGAVAYPPSAPAAPAATAAARSLVSFDLAL